MQHSEIVYQKCSNPGCTNNICSGLCERTISPPNAIAHATHSEEKGTDLLSASEDLEEEKRPQYIKYYEKPHLVENVSTTAEDQAKTVNLNKMLDKIKKDHEHNEHNE